MIIFSLILNTLVFFIVLNYSYIKNRRDNSNYPSKPFARVVLFPLALGIVFTLIVDAFKGIMMYQLAIFLIVAVLLYWFFYASRKN